MNCLLCVERFCCLILCNVMRNGWSSLHGGSLEVRPGNPGEISTCLDCNQLHRVQICQKSRGIGCVIPYCKLQCGITQPIYPSTFLTYLYIDSYEPGASQRASSLRVCNYYQLRRLPRSRCLCRRRLWLPVAASGATRVFQNSGRQPMYGDEREKY